MAVVVQTDLASTRESPVRPFSAGFTTPLVSVTLDAKHTLSITFHQFYL